MRSDHDAARAIDGMFDELVAIGERLSDESRAARPADQPGGADARLSALYWWLTGIGGAKVENAADLFSEPACADCGVLRGTRTSAPMSIHGIDAPARRSDGVRAIASGRTQGVGFELYSERFLALLSDGERSAFEWRQVDVTGSGRVVAPLFEIVASARHTDFVALRGGNPDRFECETCLRLGRPTYSLVGDLPDWLNPTGGSERRGVQPDLYVAADALGTAPPSLCTAGESTRGVSLLSLDERAWPTIGTPGFMGINRTRVGAVARHLVDATP